MNKVAEYRNYARECRTLAQRSQSSEDRKTLLYMATTWESVVDDRERTLSDKNKTDID
jgi:hypothetical protein